MNDEFTVEEPLDEVGLPEDEVKDETGAQSLMERLRARRDESEKDVTHELEIPGYGGELVCIYRQLTTKDIDTIQKRVAKKYKKDDAAQGLYGSMDVLIESCQELGVRIGGTPEGEYKSLASLMKRDEPVTYSEGLEEFLALKDCHTAREVVYKTFGGKEAAIIAQQVELFQWMTGTATDVTEAFLGES